MHLERNVRQFARQRQRHVTRCLEADVHHRCDLGACREFATYGFETL
jgi:hypothetical protein